MNIIPSDLTLPKKLEDIDADFMTKLLRARGVIASTNSVTSTEESDVGMTWFNLPECLGNGI